MSVKKEFIKSLKTGYVNYLTVHARSTKKIIPMHKCISEILMLKLGAGYEIKALGIGNGKEHKFKGKYYNKDLDITIFKNDKPISALSFKFATSNYKQNSNNYFEGMLGETANLKRNDLLYGQMLVLKQKMPYFSTDKKQYTGIEKINEDNLKKYFKLHNDGVDNLYHKPDIMYIAFVNTGDEKRFEKAVDDKETIRQKNVFNKEELLPLVKINIIKTSDLDEVFSEEMKEFLEKHGDFDKFIDAFVSLTKGRTYGRE